MTVLFEDEHVVVAVKPAGVPSQPDPSGDADMTALLGGGLFVVHRLDRPVGGVMVYAKDAPTCASLSAAFADKERTKKEYLAVLGGVIDPPEGRLDDYLVRDARLSKAFVVDRPRAGAKAASLSYERLAVRDGHSLVRVDLHTGRFHQIRVQFASRGTPIVGDGKYGSREKSGVLGLFACRLSFPYRGKTLTFSAVPDPSLFPFSLFSSEIFSE